MKKTIVWAIAIAALGGIVALYFYLKKSGKIPDIFNAEKMPGTATPPFIDPGPAAPPPVASGSGISVTPTAGLFSADDGPGGAAVEKRMADLQKAGFQDVVVSELNPTVSLYDGVEYLGGFINGNVAGSTLAAGSEKIPLLLNNSQRNAVRAISELKYAGNGYWDQLKGIVQAATSLRAATGIRILAENMYNTSDLNPIRNGMVWPYTQIKSGGDTGQNTKGTQRAIVDISTFGKNWLDLSDQAAAILKERAIQDLRLSGWKFTGYDAPTTT